MRNTQNNDDPEQTPKEPFPWKKWLHLRLTVFGTIGLLFVGAMVTSMAIAGRPSESYIEKQGKTHPSQTELSSASASIGKAFATLPDTAAITYLDAVDTCTEQVDSKQRIICLKGSEYAKLGVDKKQTPLENGDDLAMAFEAAGWQRVRYNVTSNSGAKIDRQWSKNPSADSPIHLAYTSPPIDGKVYCAGLIYDSTDQPAWHGTLSRCKQ